MNSRDIILEEFLKKYMKWFNLDIEEALSFILSNPFYFAAGFVFIDSVAKLILPLIMGVSK